MNLTKYEQETIITYNQEDDTASCFTYDRTLICKLDAMCKKSPSIIVVREGDGCKEYTFPRKWIGIKTPRQLSEEQRQKAAERARRNFGKEVDSDDGEKNRNTDQEAGYA